MTNLQPFWSVMIPTYNPAESYLKETLQSVLREKVGTQQMEIVVVDDCSPNVDTGDLVRKYGSDGVEYVRNAQNLGLAGTWNTCIERARGQVVHVLHQDDVVFPGFYTALGRGFEACPGAGAAFCRHSFLDERSVQTGVSRLERETPGLLSDFQCELACRQLIHCPAIAVRKRVYDQVGKFRSDLRFVLDWDMWLRIALKYPMWFEPALLAGYRIHSGAETSRLALMAADAEEVREFLRGVSSKVEGLDQSRLREAFSHYARMAVVRAEILFGHRQFSGCFRQLFAAFRLSLSPEVFGELSGFAARVVRSAGRRLAAR